MSPDKAMETWGLALRSLERNCSVTLLYVLESSGSSPGRQGFFMVVNAEGEMQGSIGGGIMEHKFTEMAVQQLQAVGEVPSLRRQVHRDTEGRDRSGMICSGEQTILLYTFRREDVPVLTAMRAGIGSYRNGTLRLSPAGIGYSDMAPAEDYRFWQGAGEDWLYEERTGYKNRLYVIGAGHCALAFSQIMRMMDFYITVVDHRSALPTLRGNGAAHEKWIVGDYAELGERVEGGAIYDYAVVMTLGYRTDDRAIRALLGKDFKYLGLLGSRAKVGRMLEQYRAEGISEERLGRIHTPAGLPINSRTPEEIAISIAAEIIKVKNG